MGKKIGIMGGTFNPIHNGHLLLGEAAREVYELDEILFMPSGNSYMKNAAPILDGSTRAAMVELAIKENLYFSLSEIDLKREGPTYTCDTLAQLKEIDPSSQYYFIMGADNLLELECWKNAEYILRSCIIIASVRGTGNEGRIQKLAGNLIYEYQADVRILPERYIDISSSEIRRRLKDGKSVRYMLPDSVLHFIEENELYQAL